MNNHPFSLELPPTNSFANTANRVFDKITAVHY